MNNYIHELKQGDPGGAGKQEFGVNVLVHNWYEARFDPRHHSSKARIYSDQEKNWQTEYQKTVAGGEADGLVRRKIDLEDDEYDPDDHFLSETQFHYTDATDKPHLIRKFVGGKKNPDPPKQPFAERSADYAEKWTVNSLKTRERMKSEAHRAYVSPSQQVHAELRLFGIPTVDALRTKIWKRGGKGGFRGLVRVLRIFDENGNKKLDRYELDNALQSYGLYFKAPEMDQIMDYFDTDGSGQITVNEFLRGIRGTMNDSRKRLVSQAYGLLDANGDGHVTYKDIKELYDVTQHPDVQSRSKTQEQVISEFVGGWDKDGKDGISWAEFLDYYEDVSTGIDSDDYFELMMRNTWHISGGEGVCANTSCRRVLVMHTAGHSTVEEIKNDLGIGPDEIDRMRTNLQAQGIHDIKKIQLYS
jgi:Ca2+-binding EF-hand superfamily protein|uniref:EF-hand domain-containing protein n=1 Tax=Eutreptiella gymnastica TaxID=73025 RepID=A0A7S4FJY2_9EUGL|mmetsp:Transcript_11369/g.20913  ORF Transcript_11369/g.20913 Transcript_11369/m.20913 type:complete len:416 (+) Transcript_11369:79-1326(+)|eukprot:CAMPEP_0174285624 /NCGR_PEP_ID=MMETSP0809-20121228/9099_1 /TAXON_ID=73025 ORGANISM="Eutreptiella gymnastica-like, Strain CCMP1594" /NCGR_SAMPLE_ID=MMETSP0809 /ASSEMBLY_ACC=CAM_ASM_000658 /LENGTH=415 /DNA_ID=CAMNT_0015381443 /DNA_START=79 /DNA_END=1326 /DNA_ORIENTATION=+